jgi:hypothetical protein
MERRKKNVVIVCNFYRYLYEWKNNKLGIMCNIKHKTSVFAVGFSPFHSDLFATGDANGALTIFSL